MELIYLLIGAVIGTVLTFLFRRKTEAVGTLEVDYTNPEKEVFRFVVDTDLDSLVMKKYVLIKVQNNSQK